MERYVNKGSPSGFTSLYTTSPRYDPRNGEDSFLLPYYVFSPDEVESFGDEEFLGSDILSSRSDGVPFPIHPDMIDIFVKSFGLHEFEPEFIKGHLAVVPTANGRTVLAFRLASPIYIKLHYEGCLGRVLRGLPKRKAVAGPEISTELAACIDREIAPESFAILRERLARIKKCRHNKMLEVGVVFRDKEPYPHSETRFLIPFFSLFSQDLRHLDDPLLLVQILDGRANPLDYLLEKILLPILTCYKFLAFERGLIPEINGQNIFLEIDNTGSPTRIVHRDFQGYEKDLSIRRAKGLPTGFYSYPYKCIDKQIDARLYYVRHSFSYDFKLGEYIFEELLAVASKEYKCDISRLRSLVAGYFHRLTGEEVEEHFSPSDKWYAHEKVLLTEERPYVELNDPKFR